MEKSSSKTFVTTIMCAFSTLFVVVSIIPIIGPSIVSFVLGFNVYRYKTHGLRKIHFVVSITIGELIFFIISSLIIKTIMEFYNPKIFWYIVIIGFVSNYLFSIIFYFLGSYKAKLKKAKFLENYQAKLKKVKALMV